MINITRKSYVLSSRIHRQILTLGEVSSWRKEQSDLSRIFRKHQRSPFASAADSRVKPARRSLNQVPSIRRTYFDLQTHPNRRENTTAKFLQRACRCQDQAVTPPPPEPSVSAPHTCTWTDVRGYRSSFCDYPASQRAEIQESWTSDT